MKYTQEPWFFDKTTITGQNRKKVAEVFGDTADERNDNVLLLTFAPAMIKALLAEEAFNCMPCTEGDEILTALGYKEGNKYEFVKKLRKDLLIKLGLIQE